MTCHHGSTKLRTKTHLQTDLMAPRFGQPEQASQPNQLPFIGAATAVILVLR
jgi:hypothetical protein